MMALQKSTPVAVYSLELEREFAPKPKISNFDKWYPRLKSAGL